MTNTQIIEDIAREIYGEETVEKILKEGMEIPLHTFKGWAARGPFRVKKGEHGIETRLWKKKRGKETEKNEEHPEDGDFVLVKSYLFRADQIEKVQ